jgi:hypothetical protein
VTIPGSVDSAIPVLLARLVQGVGRRLYGAWAAEGSEVRGRIWRNFGDSRSQIRLVIDS